jgi:molybdopterin molybdotransferase
MTLKGMFDRIGAVSREDALAILNERFIVSEPAQEEVALGSSLGRILARDILSPADVPAFDRSTRDGYAVRSSDTFGAAESQPALFTLAGEIIMGTMPGRGIGKGEVMKIATGGALPPGTDAVVMVEHTRPLDAESIEVVQPVAPDENIMRKGDDFKQGDSIISKGHRIRPQDMAALASAGIMRVAACRKPRVAIVTTGNELVPAENIPGPGQIRDGNSLNLEGLVIESGGVPVRKGIVRDDYALLRETLEAAVRENDLVVMSGGSSVGTADLTASVIDDIGKPGVLVHGALLKPGKPLVVGLITTPLKQTPIFGLPGPPAAVSTCFEAFVKPVIARLSGEVCLPALEGVTPYRLVKARLARGIASKSGREDHVRVVLEKREDGLWALPILGASGLISTLVKASGTVVVPVNKTGIEHGEEVEVRLF